MHVSKDSMWQKILKSFWILGGSKQDRLVITTYSRFPCTSNDEKKTKKNGQVRRHWVEFAECLAKLSINITNEEKWGP